MTFNKFETTVLKKFIILLACLFAEVYIFIVVTPPYNWLICLVLAALIIYLIKNIFEYITNTNRKLVLFLESITHSDFSLKFKVNSELNDSFDNLNSSFNSVLEAFQRERFEKQEHLQYLNTIIKHVNVGLIAFNIENDKIEFLNNHAKILLNQYSVKDLKDLQKTDAKLYNFFKNISPKKNRTLFLSAQKHIAAFATILKLSNKTIKIIALQNIYRELRTKEMETWQKLTSVLRHEIMNSITPITSISKTLLNIIDEDFEFKNEHYTISESGLNDIREGLIVINERTYSLTDFVSAYKSYTSLPKPKMEDLYIPEIINKVGALMKIDFQQKQIHFEQSLNEPERLTVKGDASLLEMVLINLLKNATDAVTDIDTPQIKIYSGLDQNLNVFISVKDNGKGISEQALEKIFIPFFTTKSSGSGIGLSISRQIMEMHNGSLIVGQSEDDMTTLKMVFHKE
ncbi:sensor histidine kinase [Ascidiimonas sp. W6]|uniref:sensor histidine kinase n=1 Tax=Ascidiimonas meishanensis TaxID=3128903 RepID=UPI0030EF746E